MAKEASKTRAVRSEDFYARYFAGRVLDIGCGTDPVVPSAVPFDQAQGDANCVSDYLVGESFHCVHSSHCLEHMRDPRRSLMDWWTLVKPGGYLVVVVPDEDLYEQGVWPSRFNTDHKHTFRLGTSTSWSPVSWDLLELMSELPGAVVLSAERHDRWYVYQRPLIKWRTPNFIVRKVRRLLLLARRWEKTTRWPLEGAAVRTLLALNCTVDQTSGRALAQIQVVAQKARRELRV